MNEPDSIFFELLKRNDFKHGWKKLSFHQNEIIISEGGFDEAIFLIIEGTVRIFGNTLIGKDYHFKPGIRDLSRGEVFGEMSMIDNAPHSVSVIAVSDCDLILINSVFLQVFMDEHPEIGYAVFKALCLNLVERLRKTNKQLFSILAWGLKVHGYDQYMKE